VGKRQRRAAEALRASAQSPQDGKLNRREYEVTWTNCTDTGHRCQPDFAGQAYSTRLEHKLVTSPPRGFSFRRSNSAGGGQTGFTH
jgi:hypothetical protein